MFEAMIRGIREETVRRLFIVRIARQENLRAQERCHSAGCKRRRRTPEEAADKEDQKART